jgi:MerR family transcriptional regulator, copper efflux regulator
MTKYFELGAARRDGFLNIGEAARAAGVSAKMIRHYEDIGVVPKPPRTAAGYRLYREADVHTLRFVHRARELGFPIKEIAALVGLWRNQRRSSADVHRVASRHLSALDLKIEQMDAMRRTLRHLLEACHRDDRPDCPILDDLADTERLPTQVRGLKRR